MPIATMGIVIGDTKKAVMAAFAGNSVRTSAKLAQIPKRVATVALARATSALMNVACPIRWILAMFPYQSIDSALGGNSIKNEALNETMTVSKTGNSKNTIVSQPIARTTA
jgi:hypothetical protein